MFTITFQLIVILSSKTKTQVINMCETRKWRYGKCGYTTPLQQRYMHSTGLLLFSSSTLKLVISRRLKIKLQWNKTVLNTHTWMKMSKMRSAHKEQSNGTLALLAQTLLPRFSPLSWSEDFYFVVVFAKNALNAGIKCGPDVTD